MSLDKPFFVSEKELEERMLNDIALVANKLGLDGIRVDKVTGPYVTTNSVERIYILKCYKNTREKP